MRSFQGSLEKFTTRGVRIVAISVDPPDVTKRLCEKQGYTFLFLSDPRLEVIRKWDLVHPAGGMGGADIARPAEFLLDPGGVIRWVNLTESYKTRVNAEMMLGVLDKLGVIPPQ